MTAHLWSTPSPSDFSITVQAAGSGTNYPDANVRFWVRDLAIPGLNFDSTLNTNGLANVAQAILQDGFKGYFLDVVNTSGSIQPFSFQMNGVGSTNPAPIISGLSLSPDGSNFLFTVSATGGLTYGLEASSDLTPGSWLRYTNFVQIGPMQLITVPIDPNYPKRFFRIASP